MTTADASLTVAYWAHTRIATYDGVVYYPSPGEIARTTRRRGLRPDTAELIAAFDDVLTEQDVETKRWEGASIRKELIVDVLNLSLGSVDVRRGYAGRLTPKGGLCTIEFRSLSSKLHQQIGDHTSAIDRRRRLSDLGINIAPYTHAATVQSVTNRAKFKVDYVQPSADYFKYGLITFTSGDNDDESMEVKASTTTDGGTRTEIELFLPMPSDVAVGNSVSLVRGYDGTRESAKALGAVAVLGFEGEPDLPGLKGVLIYPN